MYTLFSDYGDSEYQHFLGADAANRYFISSNANLTAETALQVKP